jgi:hypothetical protein
MQRMRGAGTPRPLRTDAAHRNTCLCVGSVYGLVSGTILPGRLPTPKRSGIVTRLLLTYRCGGSAGLAFVGFTGFPFHSCDREVDKHLNAASVWRPSSAASTPRGRLVPGSDFKAVGFGPRMAASIVGIETDHGSG